MPGLLDDIIIKGRQLPGLLDAALHEAQEVEKYKMLGECADLDKKLHDAYVPFRQALIEVTDEMKDRVTRHVTP